MDQDKYIKEELDRLIDQEFDFDDIIGHRVEFSITGTKNTDNSWAIDIEALFSMSINGLDWASVKVPVSTMDEDYDSALATAMMAVSGGLNNPELLARIRYQLNQHEKGEGGIIEGTKVM